MKRTNLLVKVIRVLTAVVLVCIISLSASVGVFADSQVFNSLNSDSAVVTEVSFGNVYTGTAPFDNDDAAGNDSSANNKIIRTFDSAIFDFSVTSESYTNVGFKEARVKIEIVLPLSAKQAEFDVAAMAWMDNTEGYEHTIKTEQRNIGGQNTECQVLTCYKYLIPSEGNLTVVPGNFTESAVIKILNCVNGTTFKLQVSAALEYSTWEGECPTHNRTEKQTALSEEIIVSAKPKYNLQLTGAQQYKYAFDFNSGNTTAANYGEGLKMGRSILYGLVLQLYNDNASKGLKGIELPDGSPITFDMVVTSKYKPDDKNDYIDVTNDYTPLAYSCDAANASDAPRADGRYIAEYNNNNNITPYNKTGETLQNNHCFNGGNWKAVQNGNRITFTVSDYEINMKHFPEHNRSAGSAPLYGEKIGIGCFSAGECYVVQPFNKGNNVSHDYDIQKDYGAGAFSIEAQIQNLKVKSMGGTVVADSTNTNDAQMVQNDDRKATTLALYYPGVLVNRVFYTDAKNYDIWDLGTDGTQTTYRNGEDVGVMGGEVVMVGGLSYNANSEPENQMYYATNLLKFYGEAFEPTGVLYDLRNIENYNIKIKRLYATKPDGTDWVDDDEQKTTYEDDLVFYENIEDIPTGHLCVGFLFCFEGPTTYDRGDQIFYAGEKVKIKDDESILGKAYPIVSTTRFWSKKALETANVTLAELPSWLNQDTKLSDFPKPWSLANVAGSTFYTRETYATDGSGALGTHNSDWAHWGDTLLVTGYTPIITKNLAQKVGSDQKTVYNLDAGQRVVDFAIDSQIDYKVANATGEIKVTVSINDTLPEHLYYVPNSAFKGGEYTQSSERGGTKGIINGGEHFEPIVTLDGEGRQKLVWIFEDVTVGTKLPTIYFSCNIGTLDNAETDVPIGTTSILNVATIYADGDYSSPTVQNRKRAEVGITVTKGAANSFGKYVASEYVKADGEAEYVVYFNNNASVEEKDVLLVDTMPFNKVAESDFTGSYKISKWHLDEHLSNVSNLKVYYTEDEAFKNVTAKDLTVEEVKEKWIEALIDQDYDCPELVGKTPTAWAVIGDVEAHRSIHVHMNVKLEPTKDFVGQNVYINRVSYGETVVPVKVTTEKPNLEKFILKDGEKVKTSTAAIEEKVEYLIESKVPLHEGFEKYFFVVNDTLDEGLTFGDDIVVTIGDKTLMEDTDYAVYFENNEFKLAFFDIKGYEAFEDIKINYSAILNENAKVGTVGNVNVASLTYSNDPESLEFYEGSEKGIPHKDVPTGKTDDSVVITYTASFKLIKTNELGEALEGVVFELEGANFKETLITDQNGEATIVGINAGEYTLKEIKTPNGYKALNDVKFTISCQMPSVYAKTSECKWEIASNDAKTALSEESVCEITVVNELIPVEDPKEDPKPPTSEPKPIPTTKDRVNLNAAIFVGLLALSVVFTAQKELKAKE